MLKMLVHLILLSNYRWRFKVVHSNILEGADCLLNSLNLIAFNKIWFRILIEFKNRQLKIKLKKNKQLKFHPAMRRGCANLACEEGCEVVTTQKNGVNEFKFYCTCILGYMKVRLSDGILCSSNFIYFVYLVVFINVSLIIRIIIYICHVFLCIFIKQL